MYVCVSAREDAQEVCCALVYGLYLNGRQVGKVRSVLSIPVVFITMNILFSANTFFIHQVKNTFCRDSKTFLNRLLG